MRRLRFTSRNRSDNLLHIETDLGIVNVRVGLVDREGERVEHIEVLCDEGMRFDPGEPTLEPEGWSRPGIAMRIIEPREEGDR